MFQLTIWSLPPLLTTLLAMSAYTRAMQRESVPGLHALRFLFACVVFFAACQTISSVLVNYDAKLLAQKLSYIGISMVPVAWMLFALTYTQRVMHMPQRIVNALSIVPTTTLLLVFTNEYHRLIWSNVSLQGTDALVYLAAQNGYWYSIHIVYSYGLILLATGILGFALAQAKHHTQSLMAAILAPMLVALASIYYLSPNYPLPWFDLTTVGYLLAVLTLDRGILKQGFLHRTPIQRERIVEHLTDPVLVISADGMVLDANQSALTTWVNNDTPIMYRNISELIDTMPAATLRDKKKNTEVTIRDSAFEVSATNLDQSNPNADVALVFRDVTARRKAERELRKLKDELERMAHTDALTNMFNRRVFMQRLGEEFERVRRHGSVLSVLIYDLDHFKNINDTYGHDVGDAVLVAVSDVTSEIKRLTDVACRLGGEEFALLLPETDQAGATQLANRLREAIEAYPYKRSCGEDMQVTASIGVATVTQRNAGPEKILKVADRALYQAKNSGRNRVCIDNELS